MKVQKEKAGSLGTSQIEWRTDFEDPDTQIGSLERSINDAFYASSRVGGDMYMHAPGKCMLTTRKFDDADKCVTRGKSLRCELRTRSSTLGSIVFG